MSAGILDAFYSRANTWPLTSTAHYRFNGADNVFEHRGPWTMDGHPKDAAFAILSDQAWRACTHLAQAVPYSRFAQMHAPCEQAELLFFRGYAGENAHYAFGVHQTNGTGYCSQEKANTGDKEIFELFWEPRTRTRGIVPDPARSLSGNEI